MPSPLLRLSFLAILIGLDACWAQVEVCAEMTLRIVDYTAAPITGSPSSSSPNAGSLARINFLAEEPGGANRFFVNDLNGPLYMVDKQTGQFNEYLNFNGRPGMPGLFQKLSYTAGFAMGLVTFEFDPDYANNGKFYTVHMEEPNLGGSLAPDNTNYPGLNVSGYTPTTVIDSPGSQNPRENVLIEWTDTDTSDGIFAGTARELLRLEIQNRAHPLGDIIFNPTATPGSADWRVMYLASGDGVSGETTGDSSTRQSPQRLDTLVGKILRIIPDLEEHETTSTVSDNGRYRIPEDNPFVSITGARDELYAVGLRNPHRLSWDVEPNNPANNQLIASDIGLDSWEEINLIHAGQNYGYSEREGNQRLLSNNTTTTLSATDTVPVRINSSTTSDTVTPTYPVLQYGHDLNGGDAISDGFVYRGTRLPALQGKFIFGDITSGRLWFADYAEMLAADDDDPSTLASFENISLLWDDPNSAGGEQIYDRLYDIVLAGYLARGGQNSDLPGNSGVFGTGRADIRLQVDASGELYVLSKSDGVIRALVGMPGDYNGDGSVDAADYTVWRDTLGSTQLLAADGNLNFVVDMEDYGIWKSAFGSSSAAAELAGVAVPEPTAWVIGLGGLAIVSILRTRGRWRRGSAGLAVNLN